MSRLKYVPVNERSEIEEKIKWELKSIGYDGRFFPAFIGVLDGVTYAKPYAEPTTCPCGKGYGYHSFEYERIFGFGLHCDGFDENKILILDDA